jgi:acyl-coenzyme A thioesterase PaaI-like protein
MRPQKEGSVTPFHRTCFACGADNPEGLQIRFETDGTASSAAIVIDERFQGYEGIAQGGIVATVLDTAMVQLLRSLFGGHPVTMRLDVRYHTETPVGTTLRAAARVTKSRGNIHWAAADILYGIVPCASAQGVFTMRHNSTPLPGPASDR